MKEKKISKEAKICINRISLYEDYITNSLDENGFLDQQIKLVEEVKERLINIFKD